MKRCFELRQNTHERGKRQQHANADTRITAMMINFIVDVGIFLLLLLRVNALLDKSASAKKDLNKNKRPVSSPGGNTFKSFNRNLLLATHNNIEPVDGSGLFRRNIPQSV